MEWVIVILLVIVIIYFSTRSSSSKEESGSSKESSRSNNEQTGSSSGGYGKWIGGGLGWAFGGGPIGGLIGFLLGSAFDGGRSRTFTRAQQDIGMGSSAGDFNVSLMVLAAAVMKADGKVVKSELEYVKAFLVRNYRVATAEQLLLVLRDLLQKDIPVDDVCHQVNAHMSYEARLQLMHFLFGIAKADGSIPPVEIQVLKQIAVGLSIAQSDYSSVEAMFVENTESAYRVLGVTRAASDSEIKSAYRAMAIKHHPDKVAHLGEEVQNASKEKFQQLNDAYEKIKKERNIV